MDDGAGASGDGLVIRPGGNSLNGEPARALLQCLVEFVAVQGDLEIALVVGAPAAAHDRLARRGWLPPPAAVTDVRIVDVVEAVAPAPRRLEGVALRQHVPLDRRVRQRSAEVVRGIDGRLDVVAALIFGLGLHRHLELWRTVGGDLEALFIIEVLELDRDGVIAQCRAFLQIHGAVEGAQLTEWQHLLVDLGAVRAADHHPHPVTPGMRVMASSSARITPLKLTVWPGR